MKEIANLMLALAGAIMSFVGLSTSTNKDSQKMWVAILIFNVISVFILYAKIP